MQANAYFFARNPMKIKKDAGFPGSRLYWTVPVHFEYYWIFSINYRITIYRLRQLKYGKGSVYI